MRFSRERWKEIDAIFTEALGVTATARPAFLDGACRDRPDLRAEVEELLVAAEASRDFPDGPGRELVQDAMSGLIGPEQEPSPSRIGDYRIEKVLGRGGMGTVYLASRDEAEFEQRVALKVLRRGLDTDDIVRRFQTERQILAGLQHPNIARLIDGGATADGRPWLAMECVEGAAITDYCDNARLGLHARIQLMLQVIAAVDYAHRHLIVHRDLKPGNILVNAEGEAKLVDFGIAKLLGPDDEGARHTRTGFLLLTPQYASPEQFRGEPISTSTDVYQLGVVLYELLTGQNPHPAKHTGESREIRRPSSVAMSDRSDDVMRRAELRGAAPSSLRRSIRGDLDAIVMTALAEDTGRRYASARELGDDLRRYLNGEAVLARRGTRAYQLQKFVRRHQSAVAAAMIVVVTVAASIVSLSVQRAELVRERDRARSEAERAKQTTEFLQKIFSAADPHVTMGETVTARELLDAGARDLRTQLGEHPELRASLLRTVADIYARLGLLDRAEDALEEVIATRRQLGGDTSDDLRALAKLTELAQPERSDALYVEALEEATRRHGAQSVQLAMILADYGGSLSRRGKGGKNLTAKAVEILRQSDDSTTREHLADALMTHSYGGDPELTIPIMEEALAIRRELHGEDHLSVATALSDLALATERIDSQRSAQLLEKALDIYVKLAGAEHPVALTLRNNLAGIYRDSGRFAEAEPLYRQVIDLRRRLYPDRHLELSYPLYGLAVVLYRQGRLDEPEKLLHEALTLQLQRGLPDSDIRVMTIRTVLGEVLIDLGRRDEAIAALREAEEALPTDRSHPLRDRVERGMAAADRIQRQGQTSGLESEG